MAEKDQSDDSTRLDMPPQDEDLPDDIVSGRLQRSDLGHRRARPPQEAESDEAENTTKALRKKNRKAALTQKCR